MYIQRVAELISTVTAVSKVVSQFPTGTEVFNRIELRRVRR